MSNPKKREQNPIEEAIGERAEEMPGNPILEPTPEKSSPPKMSEQSKEALRNLPIPQDLEALNQETEERLLNGDNPEELMNPPVQENRTKIAMQQTGETPASKPDLLPVTETSTLESPPQGNDRWECPDCGRLESDTTKQLRCLSKGHGKHVEVYNKTADKLGIPKIKTLPAEEKDLTALKTYILDNGFVVATVAMHIRMLCTSAMTTPSTTDWDFADRANIPDLVFALLHQPGYLEGIWPSLSIIMSDNKANPAWTAGISMTIAFFDIIRTLPMLKELENGK